jgi:ubiquinol-cytochrome c reductase cytochrome b subunit
VLLAVVVGAPELNKQADPTVINAYPRPDWYFIWYFALFALIPPAIENIFIIGFPLLVIVVLLALPFVAGTGERHPWRRPWAVATVALSLFTIGVLVHAGYSAPWSPAMNPGPLPASVVQGLSGSAAQGATVFTEKGCHSCHAIAGSGGQRGPDLTTVGDRLSRDEMILRIINGGPIMPAYGGNITPAELEAVVDFLAQRRAPR